MKLGVMVEGQGGLTWDRWRRLMHATEDLGFESLWRSDHFFSFATSPEDICIEAWTSLAVAASETSRIRLGVLVSPITFRHPSLMAHMAASIDQLSGGRIEVGLGAGRHVPEHEQFGIAFPPVKERMDRLEEGMQVMLSLWGEGTASFSGRYFQIKDALLLPKPKQKPHPPLLIGGGGEKRSLLMAARYADEWNGPPTLSVEDYRRKVGILREHCERAGRDPDTISCSRATGYVIGTDEAELRHRAEEIQEEAPQYAGLDFSALRTLLMGRGWLFGTPPEIIDRLGVYAEAGCRRFMLQQHVQTDLEALDLVAREVLPKVA